MSLSVVDRLRAVNKLHISERVLASHHQGGTHALSRPPGVRTIEEIEEGHRVLLSPELASLPAQPFLPQPLIDKM